MNNLTPLARTAVEELESLPDDDLYAELGARLSSIAKVPDGSDKFDMIRGTDLVAYGPLWDTFKDVGRRFFARWSREAYNLVCGTSAEDAEARKQVGDAFGLGSPAAVAAAVAAALTAYLGLAAGLAAVVATLAVRLFFQPTLRAMCDVWKEKLPA